jgi:hypothetical protein
MSKYTPLVWAKDDAGNRHLCAMDELRDPNHVDAEESIKCVDHDERLRSRDFVPSNDPRGKRKFTKSASPN